MRNLLKGKYFIYLFVLLLSLFSVFGVICEDNTQPLINCEMVTPTISCSNYTYEIYNNNKTLIENGSLTLYASSNVYYFNFSEEQGEYLIKLCDDTTNRIYVNYYNLSVFGESFNWLAIILIFTALSIICLWVSKIIKREELYILKIFLFYFGMINSFILVSLTLFISSGFSIKNFNSYFETYVILCVILLVLFIFIYVIYWIKQMINETKKLK